MYTNYTMQFLSAGLQWRTDTIGVIGPQLLWTSTRTHSPREEVLRQAAEGEAAGLSLVEVLLVRAFLPALQGGRQSHAVDRHPVPLAVGTREYVGHMIRHGEYVGHMIRHGEYVGHTTQHGECVGHTTQHGEYVAHTS